MTKVINLFGGSGAGKSTLASAIFYDLKMRGCRAELVLEYIKSWTYENRFPNKYQQIHIFGEQASREAVYYEKVDYIVTDSPLYLVPFFENLILGKDIVEPAVFNFIKHAESHGVSYHNYWLNRPNSYDELGRYQTKDEAIEIDKKLDAWLKNKGVNFKVLPNDDRTRIAEILKDIGAAHLPRLDEK